MHLTKFTSFSDHKVLALAAGATIHEAVRRNSVGGADSLDLEAPMVQTLDTYMEKGKTGFSPRGEGSFTRKNSLGTDASATACIAFLTRSAVKEFQSHAINELVATDELEDDDDDNIPHVTV